MFTIPDDFEWLYPWIPIPDDYTILPSPYDDALTNCDRDTGELVAPAREILVAELKRELPDGHTLEGLDFEAVALSQVTHKDFLFATNDESRPLARVHLTFSKESKPPWPMTFVFATLTAWHEEMQQDHRTNPSQP